jgi:hypothetical protein
MQDYSCDFAPVSSFCIRIEQAQIRDDVLLVVGGQYGIGAVSATSGSGGGFCMRNIITCCDGHRQRDFREHLQRAEALSLPAQDGEDAAAKTAGLADGGASGPFRDLPNTADQRRGKKLPTCGRRCPHGSSSSFIIHPLGRGT